MEPEKTEIKHGDDNEFWEGKNYDFLHVRSISSSSSSSMSGALLSGAILESDAVEHRILGDSFGKSKFNGDLSPFPDYIFSPSQTPPWSMVSESPSIELHLSMDLSSLGSNIFDTGLDTKPPPVQMMERPDGYDPGRIPASMFSDKPENPLEWSNASNDSLFSIQNSFSQKNRILCGMSGDLPRLQDLNNSQSNLSEAKSNPFSLPPHMEMPAHKECTPEFNKVSRLENEDSSSSTKIAKGAISEHHATANVIPAEAVHLPAIFVSPPDFIGTALADTNTAAASCVHHTFKTNHCLSDVGGTSSSSFTFPVLAKDSGKIGTINWVTKKPEEPHVQEQVPKENQTPKASKRKGCRCFPCWHQRCCCC